MKDQLNAFLDDLLAALVTVRMSGRKVVSDPQYWAQWGIVNGQIRLAATIGLITSAQQFLLWDLLENAAEHAGEAFPHKGNAGPVITSFDLWKREREAVKQQAQDSANEKPEPVPAPAAPRQLRLLCLLGQSDVGGAASRDFPVLTLRGLPPMADIQGRWSLDGVAGLALRETQARPPRPEVLARCVRQRQAYAFRAYTRAF